ncbi:hypothetical protein LINGRAHAP2_LOCUS29375 [Linum grandiflorum]
MNPLTSEYVAVRFSGRNYALWAFQFRFLIASKDRLPYLDGTAVKPDDSAAATARATWETRNAQVFSWLLGSVEPNIALTLRTHTCAATVWALLKKRYSHVNSSRTFELEYELAKLTQGELDIQSFYLAIQNLWTEQDLIATGTYSTDVYDAMLKERNKARLVQFLMKLRPEFEAARSSLIFNNTTDFDTVLGDLIRVETRLRTQAQLDGNNSAGSGFSIQSAVTSGMSSSSSGDSGNSGTAFASQPSRNNYRPQFRSSGSSQSGEVRCRHCGENGHPQSLCKKHNFCNYSKRSGHIITDCHSRKRNDARYNSTGSSSSVSTGSSNGSSTGGYGSRQNSSYSTQFVDNSGATNTDINQLVRAALSQVLPEALQSDFASFGVTGKPRTWFLDSAAFNHMTSDRSIFKTYQTIPYMDVKVTNGQTLPVAGIGHVSTPHF